MIPTLELSTEKNTPTTQFTPCNHSLAATQRSLLHQNTSCDRPQYPLKLAWALTIHKVQGMTMTKATVSLKCIFEPGMKHFVFSCARSVQCLNIYGFQPINCDKRVQDALTKTVDCDMLSSNKLLHPPTSVNFSIVHHNA
ncbi:ATP-dependent DNA helicase PIF1 [Holothuria leucospilota]|uniref:ATP-dependent DNA helicase PIF1 n=1 Tax=Holothuria leucospilota TaxID=206669 RepID=A0A9Q1BDQ4_HOLLE|nr:ATP-dependent DNA helicase PIF1 [Holothuria leucospilota]